MAHGVERPTAARLVEFLPMVYCRLLLAESGVRFPETYFRRLPDGGRTPSAQFSSEPLWNELTKFAKSELSSGVERQQLVAIAGRSAEFNAVNELCNRGSTLADIQFTEPVLMWPDSGPTF